MKLICCGSGSSGNTYVLTNGDETLILDCGLPFLEVKKALDFKTLSIKGVAVTHSHSDHAKYIQEYETTGIPVFRPYTMENLRQEYRAGGFRIISFPVVHDVPCCGYLVYHEDFGKLLYSSDTEYIRYRFTELNVIMIEANYSEEYVNPEEAKYRHVLTGHMSIDTCAEFIRVNNSPKLNHVVLIHLSDGSSNAVEFKETISKIVDPGVTVDVAVKGLEVDLGEIPF